MSKKISKEFIKAINGMLNGEKWRNGRSCYEDYQDHFYALGGNNHKTGEFEAGIGDDIYSFIKNKNGKYSDKQTTSVRFCLYQMFSKEWIKID